MRPDEIRLGAGAANREPFLDQRLQAHVVEDRQHVGQRRRVLPAVELEPDGRGRIAVPAARPHGDRMVGSHALHDADVDDRLFGAVYVAVARREAGRIAGHQRRGLQLGARFGAQRRLELRLPAARDLGDRRLEPLFIGLEMRAGLDADDVVDAGQRVVGEARVVGRDPAAERLRQHARRAGDEPRLVGVPRQIEQDGDEAVERVASGEQLDPRSVVQVQDGQRDRQQVLFADLEQLVAREVLQDVVQPPVAVAAVALAGSGQHILDLAPQERNVLHRIVVGFRGEEADETDLATGLAVGAVPAHADVVHVRAAVDRGSSGSTCRRSAGCRDRARGEAARSGWRARSSGAERGGAGRAARQGSRRARRPAPPRRSRRRSCAGSHRRGRRG